MVVIVVSSLYNSTWRAKKIFSILTKTIENILINFLYMVIIN